MLQYIIIVLFATMIGAFTGLGGGVIIKPFFDFVGQDGPNAISFYSSTAVFTMSIISIYKQSRKGFKFNIKRLLSISIGSILGGFIGAKAFIHTTQYFTPQKVTLIQSSLLTLTLALILLYTISKSRIPTFQIKNNIATFFIGFFLGSYSVFLGIGGGPLNVALLMLVYSLPIREAAIYSIATIFFSQFSNIFTSIVSREYLNFRMELIPFIIVAAIIGGYCGTLLNQRANEKQIEIFYLLLMLALIGTSLINIVNNIYAI